MTTLEILAAQAFEAHVALLKTEAIEPSLRGNPCWRALREAAYARYHLAFEKVGGK